MKNDIARKRVHKSRPLKMSTTSGCEPGSAGPAKRTALAPLPANEPRKKRAKTVQRTPSSPEQIRLSDIVEYDSGTADEAQRRYLEVERRVLGTAHGEISGTIHEVIKEGKRRLFKLRQMVRAERIGASVCDVKSPLGTTVPVIISPVRAQPVRNPTPSERAGPNLGKSRVSPNLGKSRLSEDAVHIILSTLSRQRTHANYKAAVARLAGRFGRSTRTIDRIVRQSQKQVGLPWKPPKQGRPAKISQEQLRAAVDKIVELEETRQTPATRADKVKILRDLCREGVEARNGTVADATLGKRTVRSYLKILEIGLSRRRAQPTTASTAADTPGPEVSRA